MKLLQSAADGVAVRLGTLLSASLLGWGIAESHVNVLVPAILVVVGVGFDMVVGSLVKRAGR